MRLIETADASPIPPPLPAISGPIVGATNKAVKR
jgi:hypothetical protein